MEKISEIIKRQPAGTSSPQLYRKTSNEIKRDNDGNLSISVYQDELTGQEVAKQLSNIKKAFPSLPAGFFEVFSSRIKESGFTDKRLSDATKSVIDNCIYPTPTIANFISFDKRLKIYNYQDMLKLADQYGSGIWKLYKGIKLNKNSKSVWINIQEAENAGMQHLLEKTQK